MKGMHSKEKELSALKNYLGGSSHHTHKLILDGLYFNIKSRTQKLLDGRVFLQSWCWQNFLARTHTKKEFKTSADPLRK